MSSEKKNARKSTTLGINKIPESTTVLDVANAFKKFSKNITEIKIVTVRSESRNVIITFNDVEACEKAKEIGNVTLSGSELSVFFAHGQNNTMNVVASQDKIYVKYPVEESYDDIVKMLSKISTGVTITKPESAKNYFFATCGGIDEQCKLVKELNNKTVQGGSLSVKIAIDRSKRRFTPKAH